MAREALLVVVPGGGAEDQRVVVELEAPAAHDGARVAALGETSTVVPPGLERDAGGSGRPRARWRSPAPPTRYSAPWATAAIRGRPSGGVTAAAASGGGTSASAARTAARVRRRRIDGPSGRPHAPTVGRRVRLQRDQPP